jgi:hypothetical protein
VSRWHEAGRHAMEHRREPPFHGEELVPRPAEGPFSDTLAASCSLSGQGQGGLGF